MSLCGTWNSHNRVKFAIKLLPASHDKDGEDNDGDYEDKVNDGNNVTNVLYIFSGLSLFLFFFNVFC